MRSGDGGSAHLKRSRPEFEVFWLLSATHTRRLHSSRDSGPRSGCSRSCSQLAGGGGGGGGRGLQTQAIAPAPAHFPFGSSRRRRLPVSRASIGRSPGDVTPGAGVAAGGGALKGPWLRRGLGPADRLGKPRPQEGHLGSAAHLCRGGVFFRQEQGYWQAKHPAARPAWKVPQPPDPQL